MILGLPKNAGTPKSSIPMGLFPYKPSILGYPHGRKPPYPKCIKTGKKLGMTSSETSEVQRFRALHTAIRISQQAQKFALIGQCQLQIRTCVLGKFTGISSAANQETIGNLNQLGGKKPGKNQSFQKTFP